MGRKTLLVISVASVAIVWTGIYFIFYSYLEKVVLDVPYGSPALWNRILEEPDEFIIPDSTSAVILPHHLVTATNLTKFYKGLSKKIKPDVIFIIGPNHYEEGEKDIQTCNCEYSTIKGQLSTNKKILQNLIGQKVAFLNNKLFDKEHSIYAHTTFIKNFFPNVSIVPLVLKWKSSDTNIDNLVAYMNNLQKDMNILVIGSVDFSHYIPPLVADFHDQSSFNAIQNFDQERIKLIEVDSPATLRAITSFAYQNDFMDVSLIDHTNSQDFFVKKLDETTSHEYITFSEGEMKTNPQVSFHFFGDAMFARDIDKMIDSEDILETIASGEGRFFQGNDYNVLNLEGVLGKNTRKQNKEITFNFDYNKILPILKNHYFNIFNLANNHILDYYEEGYINTKNILEKEELKYFGGYELNDNSCTTLIERNQKIALCGLNDVGKVLQIDAGVELIKKQKNNHDHVVVNIHWGEEYDDLQNERQTTIAHKLIDAGTDLIIGHHPHVIQPMEIYKGKAIFYSLGNFIFDQTYPINVKDGLSVGAILEEKITTLYVIPFNTNNGRPSLKSNQENDKFLIQFLRNSEKYQTDILGKLQMTQLPEEIL